MPEPISTTYYRPPDTCPKDPEGAPSAPTPTGSAGPRAAQERPCSETPPGDSAAPSAELVAEHELTRGDAAAKRNYVYNVGLTAAAEVGLGPLGSLGRAVSVGLYLDTANMELGVYKRVEERELIGLYSGVSVEGGQTNSRQDFDGKSDLGFAEGGALGRVGVAVNGTGGSISWGLGSGVAAGGTHAETTTTKTELFSELGAPPLRRGP